VRFESLRTAPNLQWFWQHAKHDDSLAQTGLSVVEPIPTWVLFVDLNRHIVPIVVDSRRDSSNFAVAVVVHTRV
jgi:hypothetical protein